MRRLFLLSSFFAITPCIIAFSILYFTYLRYTKTTHNPLYSSTIQKNAVSYAALPTTDTTIEMSAAKEDGRVESLRQFFIKYHSPLEAFAQDIVTAADTYGLDHRLLPAIAMQESNACKKIIKDSFNCWGWGIYGKKRTGFSSYPEAIETITKALATEYKMKGFETPTQIMAKYTPSSNGSWAHGVDFFMNQL